jgi:hypothetical protein
MVVPVTRAQVHPISCRTALCYSQRHLLLWMPNQTKIILEGKATCRPHEQSSKEYNKNVYVTTTRSPGFRPLVSGLTTKGDICFSSLEVLSLCTVEGKKAPFLIYEQRDTLLYTDIYNMYFRVNRFTWIIHLHSRMLMSSSAIIMLNIFNMLFLSEFLFHD